MKKVIVAVLCCFMLFGLLFTACKFWVDNDETDNTEATIDFTEADWVKQKGEWDFEDKILTQTASGNANRILLNKAEDQNYLDVSVDVRFSSSSVEAGVELRGTEVKSARAGHASLVGAWAHVDRETNEAWLDNVTSGDYLKYYDDMYKGR